ncbi:DUF2264 domain-containing protein [Clostridium beijerinckii]|uniref:DUF2264 domain-containing protein n=1 Tax=Clostridium beijerinckii TaxID=1520 RepID=A0A1S8SD72_CLOBE|nr:DUF2264 domain-containing protein [Clostridium beijerinckii]NRY60234.1 hypothetical protein [Clostridium beijerinckii]OOM63431.1 hypothetical protein CLBCK_09950 [Clostridium beijerinckii]
MPMGSINLFNENIRSNPLKSKHDLVKALFSIIDPLVPFLKEQRPGHLHLGNSGSVYNENAREGEAFLRPLWGIGPLSTSKCESDSELIQYFIKGLIEGTDPKSESYWGKINDYDQLAVEMASISLSLILSKDIFWSALTNKEQDNLYYWLMQINDHTIPDTNWLFFRILVNVAMKKCGRKWSEEIVSRDLDKIDSFYLNDGWYFDGYENQIDYYIPFGMHYYGLIYAKVMEEDDPKRSKEYKERARVFAQTYKDWFSVDGAAIPFGRSLTYRFAQSCFWSALAYANVEALPWGAIKGIVMRNLRYWFNNDIFSADGLLNIGYAYQNLNMAEGYNAPGSPYWALKTFLVLAVPDEHPFWTSEEEKLPFSEKSVQKSSRMIICHNKTGEEVQAFTSGQHSHEHAHADAKYEKFVYSTTFGFSVPKGRLLLKQGAFDSCLALSEGDGYYRTRYGCESYNIREDYIESCWKPWNDVIVNSFIIPLIPWHVRIHVIESKRTLDTAEGAFAAPAWIGKENLFEDKIFYKFKNCITGIVDLSGGRKSEMIHPEPNTNLLYSRTLIPTLKEKINSGKHILVSAVLGAVGIGEDFNLEENPIVILDGNFAIIKFNNKEMSIKIQ